MTSIRKRKKEDRKREEKWKKQRADRGYSDCDVWNIDSWFISTLKPMLEQLGKNNMGYPMSICKEWYDAHEHELGIAFDDWLCWPNEEEDPVGYKLRSDAAEDCDRMWKSVLSRLAFLLGEMNEETCTKKNPYDEATFLAHKEFAKKYGAFGDGLKTEQEKAEEKEKGLYRMYHPSDEPGRDDVKELFKKSFDEETNLAKYRDTCKNEFFELFSKYFWDLWD